MNIQSALEGETLTVKPEGRLDTITSPELEAYLRERYEGIRSLVLDLEQVSYVSSAGLRVIVRAFRVMMNRDGMVIRHVGPVVKDVLVLTGYDQVLNIEE